MLYLPRDVWANFGVSGSPGRTFPTRHSYCYKKRNGMCLITSQAATPLLKRERIIFSLCPDDCEHLRPPSPPDFAKIGEKKI